MRRKLCTADTTASLIGRNVALAESNSNIAGFPFIYSYIRLALIWLCFDLNGSHRHMQSCGELLNTIYLHNTVSVLASIGYFKEL